MSIYNIACLNPKTKEMEHFSVPYPVYIYIKQLECKINYPFTSKLEMAYKGRFPIK